MTSVDREMLRAPFAEMRAGLEADGWQLSIPERVEDQIRAAFRFDLTQLGMDVGETDQVAGALGGLAVALKALTVMGVASPAVMVQMVMLYEICEPMLDDDFDAAAASLAKSWGLPVDEPDLPKVPTSDKPTMTDMSGWAARLGAAQPDLHMTPEQIVEKAKRAEPYQRPTVGGPGFQRGPETPEPVDDDEVVDAEIVDPHEDEESWPAPGSSEPRRAQRRSWWRGR